MSRLALMSKDNRKHKGIQDVTLKQLISMPMKGFSRPPMLKEVLDSAVELEHAKLVIEVKPGGQNIAMVLVDFFRANPKYVNQVAVIMSFDPDVVFKLARIWPQNLPRPKLMQLTIKKSAYVPEPHEVTLDFNKGDVSEDVERIVTRDGVRLDGIYVEWTELLIGRSAQCFSKLCQKYTVGMWQNAGEPDCVSVAAELVKLGVSFVNTDFPKGFLREYIGKVQPEEREKTSLFASIVPDPTGGAGGVWKERPPREQMIENLQTKEFDLLIIGGGATGMGTALEATRQGYSVALVERGDFACGTSSKSSNMIHGGIRYLQAFVKDPDNATEQIDVVKKGLAEQSYMYNSAPYNVRPCPFMVACYSQDDKRETYQQLLKKYDELGSDDPFPESHWNTKKETLFRFPQLKQDGLLGSFVYYDGQQDDARMATLISLTAIEGGATICNYIEVQSLIKEAGITKGAVVKDTDAQNGNTFNVRAKVVVNATGPFTDAILQMDQGPNTQQIIKPAAGTHVILPDHFSPDRTGLAILETSDGRAMFYLPWMGQTIVGTTDHLSEIKPLLTPPEDDIDWIIKEVNRFLNPQQTPACSKDVLAAWIGIRPLAQGLQSATGTKDTEAKSGGGAEDTKSVPREHAVIVSDSKLVTITGGKWTSYRHMAVDTLKEAIVVGKLPAPRREMQEDRPTFEQGLVGTKAGPNVDYSRLELACAAPYHSDIVELRKKWHFTREIAENLIASYGTHAVEVACIARRGVQDGYAERLAVGYPWIMAQVVYGVRREYARTVADVLSRRTRLAQVDVLAAYDVVPRVVDVMAKELGWSQERIQAEVANANIFLESCGLNFCRKQRLNL
jgi:glycerol-3-phosphate dehydrogenase